MGTRRSLRKLSHIFAPVILVSLMACQSLVGTALADEDWQTGWLPGQLSNAVEVVAVGPSADTAVFATTPVSMHSSLDKGSSWTPVVTAPQNLVALAIADHSTIYAYSWPRSSTLAGSSRGLFKSTDGGSSWQDPTGGSSGDLLGPVRTLAIQPGNPQIVLAGSASFPAIGNNIYRSGDGGVTWSPVYTVATLMGAGSVLEIVPSLSNASVFYAVHDIYHGGAVVKSLDAGLTWAALPGAPEPLSTPVALAVDPTDANRVFVAYQLPTGSSSQVMEGTPRKRLQCGTADRAWSRRRALF